MRLEGRPSMPERNAPCPCGSGKKYKKCCGAPSAEVIQLAAYQPEDRRAVLNALQRFSDAAEFTPQLHAAFNASMAPLLELPAERRQFPGEHAQAITEAARSALLFDEAGPNGPPLAELFIARHGTTVTPAQRRYLDRMLDGLFEVYEVLDVTPGVGIALAGLVDDVEFEVEERTASRTLEPGMFFATRVMTGPRDIAHMDGTLLTFSALAAERLRRSWNMKQPGRERSLDICAAYTRSFLPPEIRTATGEPLAPQTLIYEVLDVTKLRAALRKEPDIFELDRDRFDYIVGEDSIAILDIERPKLRAHVLSDATASQARALLDGLKPGIVAYKATSHTGGNAPPGEPPSPEKIAIVEELQRDYYHGRLDTSIPELDGKTPRTAAKDAQTRPKLLALIADLQTHENGHPIAGGKPADYTWMYAELGLDPMRAERGKRARTARR